MDKLEKFIKDNRNDLDPYDPSPEVWEKISHSISPVRRSYIFRISAAAVVMLAICSAVVMYGMYARANRNSSTESIAGDELREAEMFYNSMAGTLWQEAEPLLTGHPEIERELNTGLAQIDSICKDICKDLKDNIANSEVVEALIRNYRLRITLLEEMLDVLKQNESENEKKENNAL